MRDMTGRALTVHARCLTRAASRQSTQILLNGLFIDDCDQILSYLSISMRAPEEVLFVLIEAHWELTGANQGRSANEQKTEISLNFGIFRKPQDFRQ